MKDKRIVRVAKEAARLYYANGVACSSAALSYFLMLTIFPMLICLYEMLGSLFPTPVTIAEFFYGILPDGAVDTIVDFLGYISRNHSPTMLWMAVIAMATTSAAAFRTIDNAMGNIRGSKRYSGFFAVVFSFLFSLIFLAVIYVAVIVVISGNWLVSFLDEHVSFIHISASWNWGRFVLLFLLLLALNMCIYRFTAPRREGVRMFTGAAISSLTLVGVSIVFSVVIGMSVKYPLVYGSLASVMIILFWLYVCGNIVIMGNIINVAIENCE